MEEKNRLDIILVERGFVDSREKAKKLIKNFNITVNGKVQQKPGILVSKNDTVELCGELMPYVSRGGYKLEKAIDVFNINLNDNICMDIGASTGGFTDCMLQNGAKKVYSVDVGTNQLAFKLKNDPRVVNMEHTNFRYLNNKDISDIIDFASVDVSFISLSHIIPNLFSMLSEQGRAVCLIKPQFEAGKENIGKNGVVKDLKIHTVVAENIFELAVKNGFAVRGFDYSPIKGPQGNIEYLIYLDKNITLPSIHKDKINLTVKSSHCDL